MIFLWSGVFFASLIFAQDPAALLPENNTVPGWTKSNPRFACQVGTAHTCDELSNYIDGGAVVYCNLGYVSSAFEGYGNGTTDVCIQIYDQGTAANALGVYQLFYDNMVSYERIDTLGDSARLEIQLFTSELLFISDKFFVRVVMWAIDSALIEAGKQLASHVATGVIAVEKGGKPAVISTASPIMANPEPSTGILWITYRAQQATDKVECLIYDCAGRYICPVDLRLLDALFSGFWNGLTYARRPVSAGHYLVLVKQGHHIAVKKFIIQK
ncbi:MAG: hypothetical protein A2487_02360 [Candidatus Raymondbacteria bacterium RifOxyC12_full_50_8]|uniref:T9SS type A sorting domain-containing protein n=1 Tax=Candidatus Raymondbacteria bacterium RIFOXYD12_FULL_49_13 TaxID=1817890 RepID=A0A1F7FHR4_UNCRA|nr:MAG: hypothetical protein A2248_20905 [Candidatus Raymondbacteria bacterium RIFOXYA2_FULL_49_16]OGJ99520.1 MAG: hypothetical protein A2350_05470 [Candidatus Raymondbacteria bacterium RifOxyB12_full_50_8]OGK06249.1 MAG: hypothetical protein A2519_08220 [Candidatus Raymondbacteria bacterium RIFOXYD12_FULL_49_13]OGK07706.1 MAG: hypothetical protein A2487_02360 [Candidatus Raymondbacteria bacterium RifOxyC12_full_50_8]OGP40581.1 MAG: hypothetical protein A2324_02975 [Candidatus Raymondbacteria b